MKYGDKTETGQWEWKRALKVAKHFEMKRIVMTFVSGSESKKQKAKNWNTGTAISNIIGVI